MRTASGSLPRKVLEHRAMQRIVRGSQREEMARFIAFRSHWSYAAERQSLDAPCPFGKVRNLVRRLLFVSRLTLRNSLSHL